MKSQKCWAWSIWAEMSKHLKSFALSSQRYQDAVCRISLQLTYNCRRCWRLQSGLFFWDTMYNIPRTFVRCFENQSPGFSSKHASVSVFFNCTSTAIIVYETSSASHHITSAPSLAIFRSRLKTHLFRRCFPRPYCSVVAPKNWHVTVGDLIKQIDLVLRPNFGLSPNLHKFFKWRQAFGLIFKISPEFDQTEYPV